MATVGPKWSVDQSNNIQTMLNPFSEVLKAMPRDNINFRPDMAYGTHHGTI